MLSLFKKRKQNSIVKLFRVVTAIEAKDFDTKNFIEKVLELLEKTFLKTPSDYYITGPYSNEGWKTKNGFLNALEKNKYQDVCHLLISNKDYCFSFENWSLNETEPKPIDDQIIIFNVCEEIADLEKLENFAATLFKILPFHYGYLLTLPDNYSVITERKRNGAIEKIDIAWRKNIHQISNGIVKDIYPINYIQDKLVTDPVFKELIVDNGLGTLAKTEIGLFSWKLTEQEMDTSKKVLKGNQYIFIEQAT